MTIDKIHWLGHAAFMIKGSDITIYIDPFNLGEKPEKADLILVSHDHFDHCSVKDIERIIGENTVIVATADCLKKIGRERGLSIRPGENREISSVKVEAVPAYNTNKQYHMREKDWVGYIVNVDGVRIYFAGDTDRIEEMKTLEKIDIALLPVSGTYVMTAEEAVQAALDIMPKVAIPMHYGAIVGDEKDAIIFSEKLKGRVEVKILKER